MTLSKRERLEQTIAGEATDRPPVALWRHWPGDDQRASDLVSATINFQRQYDWDFVKFTPTSSFMIADYGVQDQWVGSLEPGKDADFAIWSKAPLDSGTVCLQTWIEGKKYFDRSLAAERATKLQKEHEDLLAKAKKLAKLASGGEEPSTAKPEAFFRVSLEHEFDGQDRHCMEE